jgi:hypothetical protein
MVHSPLHPDCSLVLIGCRTFTTARTRPLLVGPSLWTTSPPRNGRKRIADGRYLKCDDSPSSSVTACSSPPQVTLVCSEVLELADRRTTLGGVTAHKVKKPSWVVVAHFEIPAIHIRCFCSATKLASLIFPEHPKAKGDCDGTRRPRNGHWK